jgi:hypothetical protein
MTGYADAVLADTPLHYWRCLEPGGRFLLDSGSNSFPMLITGTSSDSLPYFGPNEDGGAMCCDGGNNSAHTVTQDTHPSGNLALECVVWQVGVNAGGSNIFCEWQGGPDPFLQCTTTPNYAFNYGASAVVDSNPPLFNSWVHLVGSLSGTTITLYVNGASRGTASVSVSAGTGDMSLNGSTVHTQGVVGAIAEVAFYTHALSAARVSAHFAALDTQTRPPSGANRLLAQRFTVGTAGSIVTGNGTVTTPGLVGVLVNFTTIPATWGFSADVPTHYIPALGRVLWTTTSGQTVGELLHVNPQIVVAPGSFFPSFKYFLKPGVAATFTPLTIP